MSAEQDKFQADCRTAFPAGMYETDSDGVYVHGYEDVLRGVWQQQAARHAAEVAEVRARVLEVVNWSRNDYNGKVIDSICSDIKQAIPEYEVTKP